MFSLCTAVLLAGSAYVQSPLLPTTPLSSDEGAPKIGGILGLMGPLLDLPIKWDKQVVLLQEAVPGDSRNCNLLFFGVCFETGNKVILSEAVFVSSKLVPCWHSSLSLFTVWNVNTL